jgi:hypothetical protein
VIEKRERRIRNYFLLTPSIVEEYHVNQQKQDSISLLVLPETRIFVFDILQRHFNILIPIRRIFAMQGEEISLFLFSLCLQLQQDERLWKDD